MSECRMDTLSNYDHSSIKNNKLAATEDSQEVFNNQSSEEDEEFNSSSNNNSKSSKDRSKDDDIKNSWEEDPDLYGIRRSTRERKQPNRLAMNILDSSDDEKPKRKRIKSKIDNDSDDDDGSEYLSDDSDNSSYSNKKSRSSTRVQPKRNAKHSTTTNTNTTSSHAKSSLQLSDTSESDYSNGASDSNEEEYETITSISKSINKQKKSVRRSTTNRVNYREESDDKTDSDDVIYQEDNDDDVSNAQTAANKIDENVECIEKVLKHRIGRVNAVGSKTAIYNVEETGDPNKDFDVNKEEGEEQYLIKWTNWSHLHNTWESRKSLLEQRAKGIKKFENYLKKEDEIKCWKQEATPEDIEYFECQREMLDNLLETYTKIERIISHNKIRTSSEHPDYYCKWQGLPYAESTWEDGDLIKRRFPSTIEEYEERQNIQTLPQSKHQKVLRVRPRFVALKEQPEYLGKKDPDLILRDYQLDGLNWLANSWCKQNSVILADEMGLGKTIQAISFLTYVFMEHNLYGPFLIVVPLSTMHGWQREFARWSKEINIVVYLGDINSRNIIQNYELYTQNKKLRCNALLTTYEILLKDKAILSSISWAALVVDEAHRLKNEDSLLYRTLINFETNHRLLITGTPLQNSLKELWALLHFIMPEKFDNWEDFDVKYSSVTKDGLKFHDLHKELVPYLLRRVKKDVEKSLPAKVEQILRVEMTKIQKQYSKLILSRNFKALAKGAKGNVNSFLNIMMELKKCSNHAYLIRRDDESNSTDLEALIRGSGKLILLDKLLRRLRETGHRVLIFSQMVRMLDILAEYLQMRRFPFQRLDGSIKGEIRRQALDHFNKDDSEDFCFLLSTRAGGLGINLATADTVIIYDSDWNPQNDLQAQARAHRIGQKNQVNIYRLVTKNSIEEDIVERAKRKMVLDHLVIQRMDTTGRTVLDKNNPGNSMPFSKEEINSILKFGAEELFKEKDENEKDESQMMQIDDIDEILKRAETREETTQLSANEELLSQFKVANFSTMEDEPIAPNQSKSKSWEEIIPESHRNQIEFEEEQEKMKMLNLGSRRNRGQKQTMPQINDGSDDEWKKDEEQDSAGSSSDDERKATSSSRRRGKNNGEYIKGFTTQEVRRFIKSFKKFACPLKRIDTIAQDAELEEKSQTHLLELANKIQSLCKISLEEYKENNDTGDHNNHHNNHNNNNNNDEDENGRTKKKEKGPNFILNNVNVIAQQIIEAENYFEPLVYYFSSLNRNQQKEFDFKTKLKQTHWDCKWEVQDDISLLIGIYEYGYSNWECIKMDGTLNLSDKILIENKKPQSKHLQTRVDYLMKVIKNNMYIEKYGTTNINKNNNHNNNNKNETSNNSLHDNNHSNNNSNHGSHGDHHSSHANHHHSKSHHDSHSNSHSNQTHNATNKRKNKQNSNTNSHADSSNPPKKKARKSNNQEHDTDSNQGSDYSESNKRKKSNKKSKNSKNNASTNAANADDVNSDANDNDPTIKPKLKQEVFKQCIEIMRPVRKALKKIDVKNLSEKDQFEKIKKHLLEIGDKISDCLTKYSDPEKIKEWRNNLWIFVSKFTTWNAEKLRNLYKKLSKTRDDMAAQAHQQSTTSKVHSDNDDSMRYQKQSFNKTNTSLHNHSKSFSSRSELWKNDKPSENNEYAQAGWISSSTATTISSSSRIPNSSSSKLDKYLPVKRSDSSSAHSKNFMGSRHSSTNVRDEEMWDDRPQHFGHPPSMSENNWNIDNKDPNDPYYSQSQHNKYHYKASNYDRNHYYMQNRPKWDSSNDPHSNSWSHSSNSSMPVNGGHGYQSNLNNKSKTVWSSNSDHDLSSHHNKTSSNIHNPSSSSKYSSHHSQQPPFNPSSSSSSSSSYRHNNPPPPTHDHHHHHSRFHSSHAPSTSYNNSPISNNTPNQSTSTSNNDTNTDNKKSANLDPRRKMDRPKTSSEQERS